MAVGVGQTSLPVPRPVGSPQDNVATPMAAHAVDPDDAPRRKPLTDEEILYCFDEFLYHGELRDFVKAQHSFERISTSLGTDDFAALIPPCLEVLEFSNQFIRNDTLLCLMYISLGCTLCDLHSEEVVAEMRRHAAVLSRHDSLPMFVRLLDFLLGYDAERMPVEDGMLEREFRLIFNCIYIQLLFNEHDEGFIQSLELGQGRLGASLVSLLFEATKMSADNDKIPIKKVILLLLRVLQCLLDVPDRVLYPMPNPPDPVAAIGPSSADVGATSPTTAAGLAAASGSAGLTVAGAMQAAHQQAPMKRPRLREFRAFTALHLYEKSMRQRYSSTGFPAAVEEGLEIINRYADEFMTTYSFHPSEVTFMQQSGFLQDAYARYMYLRSQGLTALERPKDAPEPHLPDTTGLHQTEEQPERWAVGAVTGSLGRLDEDPRSQELRTTDARPPTRVGSGGSATSSTCDSESESGEFVEGASSTSGSESGTALGPPSSSSSSPSNIAAADSDSDASGSQDGTASDTSDATVVDLREGAAQGRGGATDSRKLPEVSDRSTRPDPSAGRAAGSGVARARSEDDGWITDGQENLRDRSPAAVFRRLYLAIFPRLTETVVLLLRLLLTSCSNVENYPGVIDMARERHATSICDEVIPPCEKAMPSEAVAAHRHREIMAAAVSGVVLILLKQARRSVSEQFSSLAQLITDSNGALVVLKFLNQDLTAAMEPRDTPPVLPCLRGRRQPLSTWVPSWPACATLRLVEVLYLLCKDSPERVRKYLIHYKAPFILKRLHRIENQQVQTLVLKLLKKQVRYLPRKWKQANMKAISAIYSLVPMSPLEDWLLNEPLGEPTTEGPSQADIRASNVVYNAALLRHLSSGASRTLAGLGVASTPDSGNSQAAAGSSGCGAGALAGAAEPGADRGEGDKVVSQAPSASGQPAPAPGAPGGQGSNLSSNSPAGGPGPATMGPAVSGSSTFAAPLRSPSSFDVASPELGGSGQWSAEKEAVYDEIINNGFGYTRLFPEFIPSAA